MDQSGTTATTDFIVNGDPGQQRLERPRSARRRSVQCVSPSCSTTSTIDDNDDADDEFPPVLGEPVPPSSSLRVLHCPTSPSNNRMLTTTAVDQRSRSPSRSPTSTSMTTANGGGPCLVNLAEARQRVLDRYDRKQRPPSSISRRQNIDEDTQKSMLAAGTDDYGALRRRQQRLEPLTTSSTLSVQHHR